MPTKPWSTLSDRLLDTPEKVAAHEVRVAQLAAEHDAHERTMSELRKARALTQSQLAEQLGMLQGEVSRMERRDDLYLSTLTRFVAALGGKLEIRATFDDEAAPTILRFGDLTAREPGPADVETVPTAAG